MSRRSRRRSLDFSHQKGWLLGRHAANETLTAGVWPIEEMVVAQKSAADCAGLIELARSRDTEVTEVTEERLRELCGSRHHQGVALRMASFPYRSPEYLAGDLSSGVTPPIVVVCDRIQDSHNFGAILRTCDAVAAAAVVIGESGQVGVTPQSARSAAGAVSHLPIVRTDDLLKSVQVLKGRGFQVAAATEQGAENLFRFRSTEPICVILGNEADGIQPELLECCDHRIAIPMLGSVGSLNVAVAAGVILCSLRHGHASE